MSLFENASAACPACSETVEYELVYSVNADRRPDLRDAIVDGKFQALNCGKCGAPFRIQPEFNFLDMGRGLWLAAFPLESLAEWGEHETHGREIFAKAFGSRAPAAARSIGKGLKPRVTFGWAAVREKLVAFDGGLDDVTLELCKLAMMRSLEGQPLGDETELRLYGFEGQDLVMAWIVAASERVMDLRLVPRSLYDEIAADPAGWQEIRSQLAEAMFVDLDRLMVESAATEVPQGATA